MSRPPSDTPVTSSAAFPRPARLLTPADYHRVFAKGRRFNSPHLQLIARIRESDSSDGGVVRGLVSARLGLTVAKRVAKRAVDRNRIKRIARDSFRHHREQLAGLDLVLVARGGVTDLQRGALREALESLWQRAETLKPAPLPVKLAPPDDSSTAPSVTAVPREPSS